MSAYTFEPLDLSSDGIKKTASFLGFVFSKPALFQEAYLHWQYNTNPSGKAIGYNAFAENGELAAHYAVQPFTAVLNGKQINAALSLNTATHPKHQGKQLFTSLAKRTYEDAASKGIELIVGVANNKSIHGLQNKLGFTNFGPLTVSLGLNQQMSFLNEDSAFYQRKWSVEQLQWRLKNPLKDYVLFQNNSSLEVLSASGYWGIQIQMGVYNNAGDFDLSIETKPKRSLLKLWMGLHPSVNNRMTGFVSVPLKLRPSPLYLSMKKLTDGIVLPVRNEIFFQALDFDVY